MSNLLPHLQQEIIQALQADCNNPEYLAEIALWDCVVGDGLNEDCDHINDELQETLEFDEWIGEALMLKPLVEKGYVVAIVSEKDVS